MAKKGIKKSLREAKFNGSESLYNKLYTKEGESEWKIYKLAQEREQSNMDLVNVRRTSGIERMGL